jgi:phosphohistidine phosphatase
VTAKRLLLIRHAKAKQGDRDLERPLARRGRDDARVIGEWLDRHAVPDLVLVSPAVRTRETWECALCALPTEPATVIDERIYGNSVGDLVDVVLASDESAETIALVGHNPSMQAMAARARRQTEEGMEALLSFPTSTVAMLSYDGPWATFDPRRATLLAVETCRGEFGRGVG